MSGCFLLLPYFVGISELNANIVDPEQTLHSVASDLHCLLMALLWDTRLKWVHFRMTMFFCYMSLYHSLG